LMFFSGMSIPAIVPGSTVVVPEHPLRYSY